MTRHLLANLGAEEGAGWPSHLGLPGVAATARLWRCLFEDTAVPLAPSGELAADDETATDAGPGASDWPPALGPRPRAPAFSWLGDRGLPGSNPDQRPGALTCWLDTEDAASLADARGWTLSGAPPEVVRRVHDKAFAVRISDEVGSTPSPLRDLVHVLEPGELREPATCASTVAERVGTWPGWTQGAFTLKPRMGCSGRGRARGPIGSDALQRSFPRLAERGGAILEPWLERRSDWSVLFHVPPDGREPIVLVGSLEQWVTPSGLYRGHLGEIDSRGRVFSGGRHEEPLREAGAALAGAARAAGYWGPCGCDGFVFRAPDRAEHETRDWLRPIVELNARYTAGFVSIGIVRRTLASIAPPLGLRPGERRAFLFALDRPASFPSWQDLRDALGEESLLVPLAGTPAPERRGVEGGPALLFARDLAALRPLLHA